MIKLINKQNDALNDLCDKFQNKNCHWYLSGENGVGKTYISTALISSLIKHEPNLRILIISPSQMINKWQRVLSLENLHGTELKNDKQQYSQINVINNKRLHILKYSQQYFDFIVYDEIHEIRPNSANAGYLYRLLRYKNTRMLGLTGTLISQDIKSLLKLIKMTNPNDFEQADSLLIANYIYANSPYRLPIFLKYYFNNISTQLSINDVKGNLSATDIKQIIMPIKTLKLLSEERLFFNLYYDRLKQLHINNPEKQILDYLDFPTGLSNIIKRHHRKMYSYDELWTHKTPELTVAQRLMLRKFKLDSNSTIKSKQTYLPIPVLSNSSLINTHKFKAVIDILKSRKKETTLILLDGDTNLTLLRDALQHEVQNAITILSSKVDAKSRESFINNFLDKHLNGIVIANARTIKTGIDLNTVNNIIWYQLLPNLADVLQTQRRARRLSSNTQTRVYYLAYKNTQQEQVIQQLAHNNRNNAATYNVRATDALSQLAGIFFNEVKGK